MKHQVVARKSELTIDSFKKAELMGKWIDGSATIKERRELFTHMLINWLEKSYGHGYQWFVDEDNCLCMCDAKGTTTPIVQFDGSHMPTQFFRTSSSINKTLSVLQSFFDSHRLATA